MARNDNLKREQETYQAALAMTIFGIKAVSLDN